MLAVVDSAGQTQTGHVRHSNEDSFLMRGSLFMVADGMGGAAAGEVASTMCAEAFAELDLIRQRGSDALEHAVSRANRRINEMAATDPGGAGLGTTVVAALVDDEARVSFASVGDSRIYLYRDGELRQLSEDHSVVGELVASGRISEEEAAIHPQRSVITRVLGAEPTVQIDTFLLDGRDGDVVLLCSDGLNSMVPDDRIAELIEEGGTAEETVRRLVRGALAGGGEDNVTVLLFRIGEAEERPTGAYTGTILTSDPDFEPAEEEPGPGISGRTLALRVAIGLGILVLLVAGVAVGLRESHFVGANESTGHIEVYQGVPIELTGSIKLYRTQYVSPVTYASLDPQTRKELFDHELRSYDGAREAVRRIEEGNP